MENDPKPVITISGDTDLIGQVLQKKLQARLKSHQLSSPKEDAPCSAFSALCVNGVKFVPLTKVQAEAKAGGRGGGDSGGTLPLFQQPAVHTFWTECSDTDNYRTHYKPKITHWLSLVNQTGTIGDEGRAESLIIYCITAEVRAKRQRTIASVTTSVEDRIRSDFKGKVDEVLQFRLASSDETRVLDSFSSLTTRLNLSCITKFHRGIEMETEAVARQRETRCEPEGIYDIFAQKLNLAVAYEMTLQNEKALELYHEASADLEEALSMFGGEKDSVPWVEQIRKAPCTSWDYPKLVWSNLAWRYLPAIQAGSSPLLHTHTFLLARLSHLLFELGRAWSVSELTINTLHCMARQIKQLKLSLPDGAFDCWAYMTCNEAIQAMMMRISADSLVSATSSLLLVRAELWQYALQKLHAIGVLCGLMPSSNVQNYDKVVISRITAGITPVCFDDVNGVAGMEDQGQKLKEILNNRKSFHTAYLTLGEMVIGAFKHAGRRRMAFRVGTMMAQFHRDLGLVNEAEDLLSDICKFYSADQWMQLSTKAYSLLADCQMKLQMEDKHVTTMLLLASLPPYPAASHDPCKWFSSIRNIAQKSPYQKLVNWEPLLELVAIHFKGGEGRGGRGGGGGGGYTCTVGEGIQAELVVKYSGPEEMTPIIATMLVRSSTNGKRLVQLERTPQATLSQSDVTLQKPSLSTLNSLGNLQDLDLESDTSNWPNSRPIGQHAKARSSSNMVTLIKGADLEGEGGGEFMLMAMRMKLQPGENRILVVGETKDPGDYFPHKVSLKWGSLDFERTISPSSSHHHRISVEPSRVVLDISLTPELGVLIAGYPLNCTLALKTGNDTSIPENATLRIITDHTVQCSTPDSHHGNGPDGTGELTMTLPSLPQHSEHRVKLSLFIPSMESTSFSGSLEDVAKSHDQTDQSRLYAWKHELQIYCDWLSPIHIARIPLMVYEPLTVTIKEYSAGMSSFLQLVLKNTCPLPIALTDPMIATELELTHLHEEMPAVLCPYESYSCIWQVKPGNAVTGERNEGSFHLKCSPVIPGKETSEREFSFNFSLSDMQTIYELRGSVEPHKSLTVAVRQSAILKYHIRNIAQNNSKQQLPNKLYYCVQVDARHWTMLNNHEGVVRVPLTGQIQLIISVSPNASGLLPLPTLTLCKCPDDFTLASPSKVPDVELVPMTNAQVYNLSHGNVVSVAPPHSY